MLVISRKTSESILIGDNIEIMVSEIGTDRVKIAIQAPREIQITRKELLETQQMNQEASSVPKTSSALEGLRKWLGPKKD